VTPRSRDVRRREIGGLDPLDRRLGLSSSARGSSRVTISILASRSIGSARSASAPSSAIATAFLASDFEMLVATSWPETPASNSRTELSGKVNLITVTPCSLPHTGAGKPSMAAR
jgi:hypothetical protein